VIRKGDSTLIRRHDVRLAFERCPDVRHRRLPSIDVQHRRLDAHQPPFRRVVGQQIRRLPDHIDAAAPAGRRVETIE
jgi:hypothetical protein